MDINKIVAVQVYTINVSIFMPEGLSVYSRGFTPLDNRYQTGDTMKTHKFFQSHATHYNTIFNGVKPPEIVNNRKHKPQRGERTSYVGFEYIELLHLPMICLSKMPYIHPAIQNKNPFLSPLQGFMFFSLLSEG